MTPEVVGADRSRVGCTDRTTSTLGFLRKSGRIRGQATFRLGSSPAQTALNPCHRGCRGERIEFGARLVAMLVPDGRARASTRVAVLQNPHRRPRFPVVQESHLSRLMPRSWPDGRSTGRPAGSDISGTSGRWLSARISRTSSLVPIRSAARAGSQRRGPHERDPSTSCGSQSCSEDTALQQNLAGPCDRLGPHRLSGWLK